MDMPTAPIAGSQHADSEAPAEAPPGISDLGSSGWFQDVILDLSKRGLRALLSDPDQVGLTRPSDAHLTAARVCLQADDVTLHGGPPDWVMADPEHVEELTEILANGLTMSGHARFSSLLRHVDQIGLRVGTLRPEAMTGWLPLSSTTLEGTHQRQVPVHPARSYHLRADQVFMRMFQPLGKLPPAAANEREDSAARFMGPVSFTYLHNEVDTGVLLAESVEAHEARLPPYPECQPASSAFMFDTSLSRTYVTWGLVNCNQGRLAPHLCTRGGGVAQGHDGRDLRYRHVLPFVRLYFQDSGGHVRAIRDLENVPVVGKPLDAPGWAGCAGADLLDWMGAWWHPCVEWSYTWQGSRQVQTGGLMLSPPEAPGLQLLVAATTMRRHPLPSDHPRMSSAAERQYQRYLGAQIAYTMAPYLAGMYSVLWTLDLYKRAARQRVNVAVPDPQRGDINHVRRCNISLLRGVLDRDDHIINGFRYGLTYRLGLARRNILRVRSVLHDCDMVEEQDRYQLVSTESCVVGWYEGATKAGGGRLFVLPSPSTERFWLDFTPPSTLFPSWYLGEPPRRLDLFPDYDPRRGDHLPNDVFIGGIWPPQWAAGSHLTFADDWGVPALAS
jgi:hypothetical protein